MSEGSKYVQYSEDQKTFARLLGTTPSMVHDARTVRALEIELQTQMLSYTNLHLVRGSAGQQNQVQLVMTEEQASHLVAFVSGASVIKTVQASAAKKGGLTRSHADMQGDITEICFLVTEWGISESPTADSMDKIETYLVSKGYLDA